MTYRILFIVTFIFSLNAFGQNGDKKEMTSFLPKSKAYDIYYPKIFSLKEDEDGIVTIYDSTSKITITISAYGIGKGMNDDKLITQLNDFVKSYFKKDLKKEDWKSYKTKFEVLVESTFTINQTNWVWYGIVNKQRLVTISINKDSKIEQEELNLIRFMINNLLIKD